jgi:copper chaperone CopZ
LERLEGVEKVQVSYADKSATITMKAGKTLDRETVAKALEATTFTVTSFEAVKPDAEDSEDSEDSEG